MHKERTSFWKKPWVASIGVFILAQFIFIIFETTGWIPNLKEIEGTLWGRIAQNSLFNKLFGFYETPHFNVATGFFVITCLIPGIAGMGKELISYLKNGKEMQS